MFRYRIEYRHFGADPNRTFRNPIAEPAGHTGTRTDLVTKYADRDTDERLHAELKLRCGQLRLGCFRLGRLRRCRRCNEHSRVTEQATLIHSGLDADRRDRHL